MELTHKKFVHLRNHSDYSIHQGTIRYKELIDFASQQEEKYIALTDNNNLFAAIKFYKQARKKRVKPILGIDCRITNPDTKKSYICTLLAMNNKGFENLKKISTRLFTCSENKNNICIDKEYVFQHNEGIIALSGGSEGEIGQQLIRGNVAQARTEIDLWLQYFKDRFYIEIQRIGKDYEEQYIGDALVLAEMTNCPVVATNNSFFTTADDYYAHEVKVCLHKRVLITDTSRKIEHTQQQFLKSSDDMVTLFQDIPEAIENTLEIAKRCTVEIELGKVHLPRFELQDNKNFDEELRRLANKGLTQRLEKLPNLSDEQLTIYKSRLEKEIDVIAKMQFSAYFLIVHEFIAWSLEQEILVGPGRGSAAGSLVAYSLNITNIDPIKNGLIFERFLNIERVSMPDMDIDFPVAGRDKVIEHVSEKYGSAMVGQIITFGTMAAKNAVRDSARVLGFSYGLGDKIAKLIPDRLKITLTESISESKELSKLIETDSDVSEIIEVSLKLEGMVRNAGTHAAGVVIAPTQLTDFSPLYHDPTSNITVTQFDKNDIEDVGLVKFDFLGLKTLTIIDDVVRSVAKSYNLPLDISSLPLDDARVYEMLSAGATDSVFQLESVGMKRCLKKLIPTNFEQIVAMLALYRPGPMQFIDDFIDRKHGRTEVTYLHPKLEPILKDTYAIAVYQEQVMRIARDLAGYSYGKADLLRRAMGKKDKDTMAKEKEVFINGAIEQGVESSIASEVFSFIEKFAEYGFNKSHSAAYAMLSYQTAWLKIHYPFDFFTAVMNNDKYSSDRLYQLYLNCLKKEITVLPPHINYSYFDFTTNEKNQIVYGLGAIKTVGAKAVHAFCEERKLAPYRNLFDFCQRTDRSLIDKSNLEALICAGVFDGLGSTRAEMYGAVEQALKLSEQVRENWKQGMGDLFGGVDTKAIDQYIPDGKATVWSEKETLEKERLYIGYYLTGHPINHWLKDIESINTHNLDLLTEDKELPQSNKIITSGVILSIKRFITESKSVAYAVTLGDNTAQARFTIFEESYPGEEVLAKGNVVVLVANKSNKSKFNNGKLTVREVIEIQQARLNFATALSIDISDSGPIHTTIAKLRSLLAQYLSPQGKPVFIKFIKGGVVTELKLGQHWKLSITEEFQKQLGQECPNTEIVPLYS